ncbi:MAG: GNAT family N-acetyltransferase [Planctomycetota bacterium]|nr:GNAT family N-acetyltransferase [Planctomycetota bacterium]
MTWDACSFETSRLDVATWQPQRADLIAAVMSILTEATTSSLPAPWQGAYDEQRASAWIASRDAEGPTLLVVDRAAQQPVGLLILFEEGTPDARHVRLGYVLAEPAWGRGLATELVAGFVAWCRALPDIASITGGVEAGNAASARVLEKNGFRMVARAEGDRPATFALSLR